MNNDDCRKKDIETEPKQGISRKSFLKNTALLGLGGLGATLIKKTPFGGTKLLGSTLHKGVLSSNSYIEDKREIPVIRNVDVLVVGGGMAGVGAAVAAGKMGMKTLLVEDYGCLGGTGTSGFVNNFCGYSSSSGKDLPAFQIVKGVGDEVLEKLWEKRGNPSRTATSFNPEILKIVLDEMAAKANVELLYFTQMVDVIAENNTIKGIIIENKGSRQAILAKVVLDCSGDGDVCAAAGVPFELGDGKGGFLACDLAFHIVNVEGPFKAADLTAAIADAIEKKNPYITRPQVIIMNIGITGAYWVNWAGIPWQVNGVDPFHLSKAAIDGRKVVSGLQSFMRSTGLPALKNVSVVDTAPKMGLRETRRVFGSYVLGEEDVVNGVKHEDGIGACAWPIEIVDPNPLKGRTFENLKKAQDFYLIPYRCLVPKNVDNLLMAGRFVSATHRAQASVRVMGPAVVMGHAVGVAAAMSIYDKIAPRNINVGALQQELKKQGAFLG